MLGLWFLGRDVEDLYGRAEFTRLYLALIVFSGIAWAAVSAAHGTPGELMGASGGVVGIVLLYALNFPRRTILFMFVIPMPAWVMGVLLVAFDVLGQTGHGDQHIAYTGHLAGALFAFLYYHQHWNFGRLIGGGFGLSRLFSRRRLSIHREKDDSPEATDSAEEQEIDRILEKIHREGEGSLTRKERRQLETASREYQKRLHGE